MMRLDRLLCEAGFGSRSHVKVLVKKGLVQVNGEKAERPEQKVDAEKDRIVCGGREAVRRSFVYLMLNKPPGVVSATEDARERTVLDLLEEEDRKGVFPVGRLDKDTEGLLLLTDDGELSHRLLSPKNHVDKVYRAKVEGLVTEEHAVRFREGLEIGEKVPTLPAELEILSAGAVSEVQVTIREGKFHQIKRMFESVDCQVVWLKRLRMGTLSLDGGLPAGAYRRLTEEEVGALRGLAGLVSGEQSGKG